MSKQPFSSVDEYIASQPETSRELLARVRSSIRKALPEAEEGISYGIPAYKFPEGPVLYFAGWKKHYSLYPASAELLAAFKDQSGDYAVSGSTIRFPVSNPVPEKLIEEMARFRAGEVCKRGKRTRVSANPHRPFR